MGNKSYRDGGKRKAKKIVGSTYAAADKTLQEAIRLANDRKSFPIWLTQFGA